MFDLTRPSSGLQNMVIIKVHTFAIPIRSYR